MNKQIYVTDFDMKRFKWLISNALKFDEKYKTQIGELEEELKIAVIVDPKDIPGDVITMNSKFRITIPETGEEKEYTLVFPFDEDKKQNKLSVIDPLGIAVIGYKAGDFAELKNPQGKREIKIEEILYQPEREGYYYI